MNSAIWRVDFPSSDSAFMVAKFFFQSRDIFMSLLTSTVWPTVSAPPRYCPCFRRLDLESSNTAATTAHQHAGRGLAAPPPRMLLTDDGSRRYLPWSECEERPLQAVLLSDVGEHGVFVAPIKLR